MLLISKCLDLLLLLHTNCHLNMQRAVYYSPLQAFIADCLKNFQKQKGWEKGTGSAVYMLDVPNFLKKKLNKILNCNVCFKTKYALIVCMDLFCPQLIYESMPDATTAFSCCKIHSNCHNLFLISFLSFLNCCCILCMGTVSLPLTSAALIRIKVYFLPSEGI